MTVQFVPLSRFVFWLAMGWTIASDLQETHHGRYSVLMVRDA